MKVELLLSVVLAVSTVCYTIINLMMWFENRATRKLKTTPFIVAFLKITESKSMLSVHLKNIGVGCAKNVKITVIKDFNQFGKNDFPLSNCLSFKNGVTVFPPEYELQYYLQNPRDIDYSREDNYIELKIDYEDVSRRKYSNNIFKLPLNQIGGNYSDPPESYLGQIPYYLKQIDGKIGTISGK